MQRWKIAGCAGLICVLIVSIGRGDDSAANNFNRIANLIQRLADADPLTRADAVQGLMKLGDPARVAVRLALRTSTPQTRPEMDRVLLHLPWVKTGDSNVIEEVFTGYGELEVESRYSRIQNISPQQEGAGSAFLRVLLNDPSPAVRWLAASSLQLALENDKARSSELAAIIDNKQAGAQMYLPVDENAPLLAAAGWVFHLSNPQRTDDLFQQAVAIEARQPSAFMGQMDLVYLWLTDRAEARRDHGRVIELLRQQASQTSWNDDHVPDAVTNLLAVQADFGTLPGFQADLRNYRDYFNHPEILYCVGRMASRQGHEQLAAAVNTAALLLGGESSDRHLTAGIFLAQRGWNSIAEREMLWSLHLSNGKSPTVYFELSLLAEDRNDDLAAAQYMEAGLQRSTDLNRTTRYGQTVQWTADDAWAEVHWHYLRAARQSNDLAGAKTHLEKLLSMDQDAQVLQKNPNMAADIVPALQDQGRSDQADKIFDTAYGQLLLLVKNAPDDAMPKNNLAWLCACAGKKLDEAAKLAEEAVNQSPEDAACLDTQAEISLRMGNAAMAVTIETHALQIKPDDSYMQKQLKRFQAAVTKPIH